uniref:hypothetical protein n=1 Tax=Helicobacter bilis TaxID=37372 RepID=UPI001F1D7FD8
DKSVEVGSFTESIQGDSHAIIKGERQEHIGGCFTQKKWQRILMCLLLIIIAQPQTQAYFSMLMKI